MQIAAAALALARTTQHSAPLQPIGEVKEPRGGSTRSRKSRASHGPDRSAREAGYVRLALDAGRDVGVRPGQVVSALARTAEIPGKALGKILIRDAHTLVDVPEQFVDQVLARSGGYRFGKQQVRAEVA